ncbi:MAG: hypothetical protein ACOVO0_15810 [Burkholderiaceae bacterium]
MRLVTHTAPPVLLVGLMLLPTHHAMAQGGTTPEVCVVNRIDGSHLARVSVTYLSVQGQRLAEVKRTLNKGERACHRQPGSFHVAFAWELQRDGNWFRVCTNPAPSITGLDRDRVATLVGTSSAPSCVIGWQ